MLKSGPNEPFKATTEGFTIHRDHIVTRSRIHQLLNYHHAEEEKSPVRTINMNILNSGLEKKNKYQTQS